jgi:hypothetical protein
MKFHISSSQRLVLLGTLLSIHLMLVCAHGQQSAPPTHFASGTSALHIPFELSSNVIFLQVRVNGSQPLWFVLDTGASLTIIDAERAKLLGIKFSIVGKAEGAGASPVDAGLAKDLSFSLSGLDFQARQTGVLSLSDLNRYTGRTVDGILGHNFFSRFVVEIDYAARLINLYDPKSFQYSGAGESVPIELKDGGANVRARLALAGRAPVEGNFRIDTGGSHALLLSTPFVKEQNVLQSVPKTIAVPAAGVGGETNVLLGRIQSLQLGRFTLEKPVTSFAQSTKGALANKNLTGNIGGGILRRFKVIFDYPNRRMILEPNSRFTESFESDMSGVVLIAEGAKLDIPKVFYVTDSSPASEAGLRVGDIITAIDGKPSSTFTLDDIREMFKQNGREYLLSIKRGEQSLQIKIKLRGLI